MKLLNSTWHSEMKHVSLRNIWSNIRCARYTQNALFQHSKCRKSLSSTFSTASARFDSGKIQDDKEEAANVRGPRFNSVNIQMIPEDLLKYLFGSQALDETPKERLQQIHSELKKHGLLYKTSTLQNDVQLKLPPLYGDDLEEHFRIIGEMQSAPYRKLAEELIAHQPEVPEKWLLQPGWTCYVPFSDPFPVPFPLEDALVFDIEVCLSAGEMPTLAVAMTPKAWYGWVSESLIDIKNIPVGNRRYSLKDLIPLESNDGGTKSLKKSCLVVGHNVSYDRARVREQYWIHQTGTRFLDMMSLHVCVSGVTSYQKVLLKSVSEEESDSGVEEWRTFSSLNSLTEVHKLYCGSKLDKQTRDLFVTGTLEDVRNEFDTVMNYCAGDVRATHNVLRELFPLFVSRFPHPVTLAGMLELGSAYLPVNSNWCRYVQDSQQTFDDVNAETRILLARQADSACRLFHNEKYRDDLWMWDQDWSLQELRLKKKSSKTRKCAAQDAGNTSSEADLIKGEEGEDFEEDSHLKEKFQYLLDTRDYLPSRSPHLPGYPAWYRKLCPKVNGVALAPEISTSMQIAPKLLSLTWESYPLHYIREQGWGFLIPHSETCDKADGKGHVPIEQLVRQCGMVKGVQKENCVEGEFEMFDLRGSVENSIAKKDFGRKTLNDNCPTWYVGKGVWCKVNIDDCCWFLKLPHKDGVDKNVGNPLAKDFINKFSENVLGSKDKSAEKVLANARMLSYWRNNCDRINRQIVVWLENKELPKSLRSLDKEFGAIVPQVVVCGTLTRRAVEPTWMTASNVHSERIGSELRAMIQSPPGFSFVGADVDSQELWIASVIGDAYFSKLHGGTPFGWMTLSGSKSEGTDMHSVTAKAIGISRDHAKVINYARIYGAGLNFAAKLLKQFNPTMSEVEARNKATKMFKLTKGRKAYRIKKSNLELLDTFENKLYSATQALQVASKFGKTAAEVFDGPFWVGGTESAMFNRLEEIANCESPVTPFLGGHLSRALEPKNIQSDKYLPTRINWVVQSGAVDFLHLMLVCMRWLIHPTARFSLSFHDEVRYLVPSEYRYQTALALHFTNLLTRSFCVRRLGLTDLPFSVAFFSSVEVDTVLRKDSHHDCVTPSNPHGLSRGYGIPIGESLNIYETIEKAGGVLNVLSKNVS